MEQELEGLPGKLYELWLSRRVHELPGTPEMPTHQGQTIREGWLSFVLPRRHRHRELTALAHPEGQQGAQREQCQHDRGRARNGTVRPLTLGFQAEMGPGIFTRDLDGP